MPRPRAARRATPVPPPVSPPAPAAPPVDRTRHVVQPGETLATIAKLAYGDATRWKLLFDANRHLIGDNPAHIAPGLVLAIPREE